MINGERPGPCGQREKWVGAVSLERRGRRKQCRSPQLWMRRTHHHSERLQGWDRRPKRFLDNVDEVPEAACSPRRGTAFLMRILSLNVDIIRHLLHLSGHLSARQGFSSRSPLWAHLLCLHSLQVPSSGPVSWEPDRTCGFSRVCTCPAAPTHPSRCRAMDPSLGKLKGPSQYLPAHPSKSLLTSLPGA